MSSIEDELNLLSFELDFTDDIHEHIVDDEEYDDEYDDESEDIYKYDDVDPEIFNDPLKMLKWLDEMS
ncbi:hypothetical protein [Eubacterium aggregans]|uniref:hypothetical protein n=1 Tax=Eubacterium aggregans TaxID=81409 RepID=UPI003F2AF1B8